MPRRAKGPRFDVGRGWSGHICAWASHGWTRPKDLLCTGLMVCFHIYSTHTRSTIHNRTTIIATLSMFRSLDDIVKGLCHQQNTDVNGASRFLWTLLSFSGSRVSMPVAALFCRESYHVQMFLFTEEVLLQGASCMSELSPGPATKVLRSCSWPLVFEMNT